MFDELVQKLKQCQQANYEAGQTYIRVLPSGPKGFPVMIEWVWGAHFNVFLDGWHQDFETYQEAVRCFALAVSGHYRLKTRSKGGFRFRWTVEYWDGTDWVEDSTTTDLFYPFWKPTSTSYLRNELHCGDARDMSWTAGNLAAVS